MVTLISCERYHISNPKHTFPLATVTCQNTLNPCKQVSLYYSHIIFNCNTVFLICDTIKITAADCK